MLQELKMYPLLEGARGKKKINKKKLCKLLVKLSTLVKKYPTIAELDINPLLVNEKESLIVDARIKFN
jgi:acetyltransferase